MVNYNTPNHDFLIASNLLKDKDISNHDFMLKLSNKNLSNKDPYKLEDDIEGRKQVIVECKRNRFYFFREVLKIDTPITGIADIPFILPVIDSLFVLSLHTNKVVTIMNPRQSFKTGSVLANTLYEFLFDDHRKNHFYIWTKDISRIENLVRYITKTFVLPDYMSDAIIVQKNKITHRFNDNTIEFVTSINDINMNYGLWEYYTIIAEDFTYIPYFDSKKAIDNFLESKNLDRVILISNYNKESDLLRNLWVESIHWKDYMYDIDICKSVVYEKIPMLIYRSPEQYLSSNQIEDMRKLLNHDEELIRSEMCIKPFYKE